MTGTEIERLLVSIVGDPSGLIRAAAQATRATADMAGQIGADSAAGAAAMARAFAGAASAVSRHVEDAVDRAIDAFAKYEESLARITGLAGASADQTRMWGKEILALGPAMGQAPKELSEAMFFISSAGLRGRDGMMALEASAKAAASGLGDVKTIAHTVTYALSGYANTGLTAAAATDIITAAVREGNMDVAKFSGALGTAIPIASAAGVSFMELAGTMAVLTHTGMSVNAAAVSVQAMLMSLVKPTQDATEALASVGLSAGELRKLAREPEGVIKVMRKLDEAFAGSDSAIAHVIPNIRALRGALSILKQDAGAVDRVMGGVRDSAGATDAAFAVMSDTLSFAFKQAKEGATAAAIELGEVLAPTVKDVARIAQAVVGWFRAWPAPLKAVAVVTVLVAAAVLSVAAAVALVTVGIVAAGIAFNLLFGGVGLLIGALVTGWAAVVAGVTAVVGVQWGLAAGIAYAAGLFDYLRQKATEAWQWLAPVRGALILLWRTVETMGAAAFRAIQQAAVRAWNIISTAAGVDWESVRSAMIDAIIAAEYALLHYQKAWDLAAAGVKYAVEVMRQDFMFFFTNVIPAAYAWLLTNLPLMFVRAWISAQAAQAAVVRDMIRWQLDSFTGMFENLHRLFRAVDWHAFWAGMRIAAREVLKDTVDKVAEILLSLPDVVRNPALFVRKWAMERERAADAPVFRREVELQAPPVQDVRGMAARAKAAADAAAAHVGRGGLLDLTPFVTPQRTEGETERMLREEFERLGERAVIGFAAFRRLRLAQIAEMDKLAREAAAAAAGTGGEHNDEDYKKHKAEKERFDAAVFGSAEAISRIAAYRDRLRDAYLDAKEVEARREAKIAADRALALEHELQLTQKIAETRREMNRREEEAGVRLGRGEGAPAGGEIPAPPRFGPLDELLDVPELQRRRRQQERRTEPVPAEVLDQIRRIEDARRAREAEQGGGPLGRFDPEAGREPFARPDVGGGGQAALLAKQDTIIAILMEQLNLERAAQRKPPITIGETNV